MQDSPKPGAQLTSESPLPRLKIIHLLLWRACTGGMIALSGFADMNDQMPEEFQRLQRVRIALTSVFSGLAVAGTITLFVQAVRGSETAFRLTGHWLLCHGGLLTVGTRTARVAARFLEEAGLPGSSYQMLAMAIAMGLGSLILVAAMFVTKPSKHWKVYLLFASACQLAYAVAFFAIQFDPPRWVSSFFSAIWFASTLGAVFLLLIGIREWWRGFRRDWLHRAGIVTVVGSVAANWLVQLLQPLLLN